MNSPNIWFTHFCRDITTQIFGDDVTHSCSHSCFLFSILAWACSAFSAAFLSLSICRSPSLIPFVRTSGWDSTSSSREQTQVADRSITYVTGEANMQMLPYLLLCVLQTLVVTLAVLLQQICFLQKRWMRSDVWAGLKARRGLALGTWRVCAHCRWRPQSPCWSAESLWTWNIWLLLKLNNGSQRRHHDFDL